MKLGTKSILFGVHQFILHPLFLVVAWWKLYGFPLDPRLWLAFFVHDLGYIGKPNMDGPEGKMHPVLGATIMGTWFGDKWHDFCFYHSRHTAKMDHTLPSRLCVADKLVTCITPSWLFLVLANLTGEMREYMADSPEEMQNLTPQAWVAQAKKHHRNWVDEHKDNCFDN